AVEQFPWDFLTKEQRQNGFIVIHGILACYMFLALAIVCDRYFVPSLEVLCELLHMETDIAGATFMAAGSSAPELATSVIGVFVAQDDVGLGTVVGSAIYNVILFDVLIAVVCSTTFSPGMIPVMSETQLKRDQENLSTANTSECPAKVRLMQRQTLRTAECKASIDCQTRILVTVDWLAGLPLWEAIRLHWWPMMRDCIAYLFSVIALIVIIADEYVVWYEALALLIMYLLYVLFMKFNERLEVYFVPRCNVCCRCNTTEIQSETTVLYTKGRQLILPSLEAETWHKLCERPDGLLWCLLWILALPLSTAMFLTVPDCRRPSCRKWFWLTFILSLVWLSLFSFLMVWMITVIGYTANVPDSVMSLTFIAFGVSLPDVVASVIVVRDGLGDMAVSNAIGSNVFDILVCLGIPWLIETCFKDPGSKVQVYSEGLLYSSIMLLSTVAFLLLATHFNGWRLTKKYGILLLVVYVVYTVFASLYELNIFGYFHPPECPSDY
ncbi:hypothetical protein BaRGS_00014536, partial [Batillaria attramentaria]